MTRAARYREELLGNIIPFWMKHSVDHERGGFWTCLDRKGNVYDDRKYVWMNGRQIWTLSKLFREIEPRASWLSAAQSAADFLRRHVYDAGGRCYFALTSEGSPAGFQRKPYSGLFVTLGLLELSKATADQAMQAEAAALFWRVKSWIEDPALLGRPHFGPPASQLADIYALALMALEMAEISSDPRYPAVLEDCFAKVKDHCQKGVLLETVAPRSTPEGRLFCPGSSFEIAWILLRANPDAATQKWLLDIIENTMAYWDQGFPYFIDIDGQPTLQLESSQRLWWVHAEALLALAHAYDRTRHPKWLTWFDQVDDWTWKHFRDPEYGEWFGYLDKHGQPELTLKGNHYKGCFHIPRALLYCSEIFRRHAL